MSNRLSLLGRDMAVDLGTANTLVYVRGRGIVLNEPSVVAVDVKDGRPLAVGAEAKRMIGRTPSNIQAIRPLKDGVIADFEICEKMLRYFIHRVHQRRFAKPRMVICVPSGITGVEQRAVMEAAEYAGARKAYIIEEPMAAAIGAGLPVHEPTGNMVVDIGGGTTEVAVISLGGIVRSQSVRIGGDELDEAIISYIKKEYSLALGERSAEEIKIALGSAYPLEEELQAEIRGRDFVTGLPKVLAVSTAEIRKAIAETVSAIIDAVKVTLDKTPPELGADIMEQGIVLPGGGALRQPRLTSPTALGKARPPWPSPSSSVSFGAASTRFASIGWTASPRTRRPWYSATNWACSAGRSPGLASPGPIGRSSPSSPVWCHELTGGRSSSRPRRSSAGTAGWQRSAGPTRTDDRGDQPFLKRPLTLSPALPGRTPGGDISASSASSRSLASR